MRWGSCMESICINRFPWIILLTGGTVVITIFKAQLTFSHQYWFMNASILSGDQQFNVCKVVSSRNFRISGRIRLLFGPNQCFLLIKPRIIRFSCCFSFPGANYWLSLVNFTKTYNLGKYPFGS